MAVLLAVLWIRYTPDLKMVWTASDPPAKGYVLMIAHEAGDTECPAAVGQNIATLKLKLNDKIRLIVVPVGWDDKVYWLRESIPSDWYVYNKWRIEIEVDPVEVRLSWTDTGDSKSVMILSTLDLRNWKAEGVVPPGVCQWWDNTGEKRKFYKALRR